MTPETDRLITERIRYPSGGLIKWLYKTPILLYRLGLGGVIGRLFMIMTTTGRTSGLPRRTAIEYHQYNGRKYVMVGWEHSDWYRNLLADPRLTIQTADGVEHVRARRLVTDAEYHEAWDFAERSPFMRAVMKLTGAKLTREQFISQKDRFILLTFDPTEEPTPPPLPADLSWALPAFTALLAVGLLVAGRRRQ